MDTFKILIEGYARMEGDITHASPSTILIYSNDKKVLMDPGTNNEMLMKSLDAEKLKPEDIDVVYLTHYHPDHWLNIRLFPITTPIIDATLIWNDDAEFPISDKIPDTNIQIIPTPGHAGEHSSLLIETKDMGKVCFAQDVFWWMDGKQQTNNLEELVNYPDPFASDMEAQKDSRQKILDLADWIVPGHGKMFKNPTRK